MTGWWKGAKSKSAFRHLPTTPWKSQKTGFPHSHPHDRGSQNLVTLNKTKSVNHAPGLKCQSCARPHRFFRPFRDWFAEGV